MIQKDKTARRTTLLGKVWPDLTRRLLFIICITVIPINILAVLVSSLVLLEARDSQVKSLQNDFIAFMNRKESLISELDNWSAEFIRDQILVLTLEGGASSVLSFSLVQELGRVINVYDIKGFTFLQEKQENKRLLVKGNKNYYTYDELETLKKCLVEQNESMQINRDWYIKNICDRYYLCRLYTYKNYNICFGIDIDAEIGSWPEEIEAQDATVILSDGQTSLLRSVSEKWHVATNDQVDQIISGGGLTEHLTKWQSGDVRGNLTSWLIDRRSWSSVPAYYWILLAFALVSLLAIAALWHLVNRQVIRPLHTLQTSMKLLKDNIQQHRISEKAETRDFDYIFTTFNDMVDEIMRAHEQELLMVKTEIVNLRLQVNPHMLLNSLNVIHSLAQSRNYRRIQEFTRSLANYFQYVLRENNRLVPLENEMKFVASYIEIQQTRFPDEFHCVTSISDEAAHAMVPPLLIENFVENAMKYARRSERPIEVLIKAIRQDDKLVVIVDDDGKGIEPDILKLLNGDEIYIDDQGQKHLGVWNCRRRLELFFGRSANLLIESQPKAGTRVKIEMPYLKIIERRD